MTCRLVAAVVLAAFGLSACQAAPAGQPAEIPTSRADILVEKPGSEPVATYAGTPVYYACAVLTKDVVTAAGLKYVDRATVGGTRLSPGGDRPELAGTTYEPISCGVRVQRPAGRGGSDPELVLATLNVKLSSDFAWRSAALPRSGTVATAHGVRYARLAGKGDDEVTVAFDDGGHGGANAFTLTVRTFSAMTGGETALAKLVDGITRNIAAGPRSMPERSYPEPYNLVARPCDALPPEVFTAVTALPTDGLQKEIFGEGENFGVLRNAIQITCSRMSLLDRIRRDSASLTVEQTIYAEGPAIAADMTRQLCDYMATKGMGGPLAQPVGDVSCGMPGEHVTGGATVYFHLGRTVVRVSLNADTITGQPAVAKVAEGAQRIHRLLDR
ncbi:hypothetical protein ABJI51_18040 [Amycolatopsis sp. NEAU-NG30]|uniref:Uncharacterized protein n=1 Tax=Amycolatopsis melonis TaxID=3156488 RepID=A0ABV0LFB8_9PSEU